MANALISDFDGTITRHDFYSLVAERYVPPNAPDFFEQYRQGKLSHFDAMAGYFSYTPTNDAALLRLLKDTDPDPDLNEAVLTLKRHNWDLIIVSAGSSWYISRILEAHEVAAVVHANNGRIESGKGLVLEKPFASPFFDSDVGINKSAVVMDALGRYDRVAFAGDGPPDVAPSLIVEPRHRFARGYLAHELKRRGERFYTFNKWSEIVTHLTSTAIV